MVSGAVGSTDQAAGDPTPDQEEVEIMKRWTEIMKRWTVDIYIDEHEDDRRTRFEARLHTGDDTHLVGVGTAKRNPDDREVSEIGDELATARALSELSHLLLQAAADDVEAITHTPVRLHE